MQVHWLKHKAAPQCFGETDPGRWMGGWCHHTILWCHTIGVASHHTMVWWHHTILWYCEPPHYSGRLPHSCQRERQFAPIVSTSYPASLWPLFPSYFYSCTRFIHSQPFDLYLVCQTSLYIVPNFWIQILVYYTSLYSFCIHIAQMSCVVNAVSSRQCVVLPLLSSMFGLAAAAALRWLPCSPDWLVTPTCRLSILQMLPCDCCVLLCFLRVPALEDVESHWLHLSTLSDWRQPAATFQCCVWLGGQRWKARHIQAHPGVNICPSQAELCIGNNWSVKLPIKWIIFKFIYGRASSMAGKICAELYVLKIDICFSRWTEECSESLCSGSERKRGRTLGFPSLCCRQQSCLHSHSHSHLHL